MKLNRKAEALQEIEEKTVFTLWLNELTDENKQTIEIFSTPSELEGKLTEISRNPNFKHLEFRHQDAWAVVRYNEVFSFLQTAKEEGDQGTYDLYATELLDLFNLL